MSRFSRDSPDLTSAYPSAQSPETGNKAPDVEAATPTLNMGAHSMNIAGIDQFAKNMGSEKKLVTKGQHLIFNWVHTGNGKENKRLSDDKVAEQYGVPLPVLARFIKNEVARRHVFLNLPAAFLFCLTFAVSLLGHYRTNELRDIEETVKIDLQNNAIFGYTAPDPGSAKEHKNVEDVWYPADLYSWLRVGLVPLLFKESKQWSDLHADSAPWPNVVLTATEKRSYLQYNRLVGGVQLSQARAVSMECRNPEQAATYDMQCSPSASILPLDLSVQPESSDMELLRSEKNTELTRWFLLDEPMEHVDQRLKQLEITNWIDSHTLHVAVHFMTYNAHYHSLTHNAIHFFFSRSGRLWKKSVHDTIWLNTYSSDHWEWIALCDAIFAILSVKLFITEFLEVCRFLKKRDNYPNILAALKDYLNLWNVVDWISIIFSMTLIIMFIQSFQVTAVLEEQLRHESTQEIKSRSNARLNLEVIAEFEVNLANLLEKFEEIHASHGIFHKLVAIFPICLMLRLFKAFSAQPRLALVTETLSVALIDVAHFLMVFLAIFSTFVLMAVALFGREMSEFSTFQRAFNTCFAVLMGDFDYASMFSWARHWGALWFWMFQIVLVLLMLNMLLAIVMDAYAQVKGMTSNMETLSDQVLMIATESLQRFVPGVDILSLDSIDTQLDAVIAREDRCPKGLSQDDQFEAQDIVTIEDFEDMIEGMGRAQAEQLMILAVHHWRLQHSDQRSIHTAITMLSKTRSHQLKQDKMLASLELALKHTNESLGEISERIPKHETQVERMKDSPSLETSLQQTNESLAKISETQVNLLKQMQALQSQSMELASKLQEVQLAQQSHNQQLQQLQNQTVANVRVTGTPTSSTSPRCASPEPAPEHTCQEVPVPQSMQLRQQLQERRSIPYEFTDQEASTQGKHSQVQQHVQQEVQLQQVHPAFAPEHNCQEVSVPQSMQPRQQLQQRAPNPYEFTDQETSTQGKHSQVQQHVQQEVQLQKQVQLLNTQVQQQQQVQHHHHQCMAEQVLSVHTELKEVKQLLLLEALEKKSARGRTASKSSSSVRAHTMR